MNELLNENKIIYNALVEQVISYNSILISYKCNNIPNEEPIKLTHIIIICKIHSYNDKFKYIKDLLENKLLGKMVTIKNITNIKLNTSFADVFLDNENISTYVINNL
jgi:hypothetical protein